jgi:acetate kinase
MKVVLAINAGSSSVKISVYAVAGPGANPVLVADAQVSGLTAPPSKLTYRRRQRQRSSNPDASEKENENEDDTVTVQKDQPVDVQSQGKGQGQDQSHDQSQQGAAFKLLLDTLTSDPHLEEIASADDVAIACHRIVHGGDYPAAQLITKQTYHHLETLSDLAPLHNGAALDIVDACLKVLPAAANVACFDSQFHTSIPPHICTYPIRQDVAHKNRLRKYGFHGISYSFITRSVADFLERDPGTLNIIALHLGSGASACAIRNGQSWDTSMGLTPLAGLPGATRSGSIDPRYVHNFFHGRDQTRQAG